MNAVALKGIYDVIGIHPAEHAGFRLHRLPVDITLDPIKAHIAHQIGFSQIGHIHAMRETRIAGSEVWVFGPGWGYLGIGGLDGSWHEGHTRPEGGEIIPGQVVREARRRPASRRQGVNLVIPLLPGGEKQPSLPVAGARIGRPGQ